MATGGLEVEVKLRFELWRIGRLGTKTLKVRRSSNAWKILNLIAKREHQLGVLAEEMNYCGPMMILPNLPIAGISRLGRAEPLRVQNLSQL